MDTQDLYGNIINIFDSTVGKLGVAGPKRSIEECILDNFTYTFTVMYEDKKYDIPLMIGSSFCGFQGEPKGYFIIDGVRKTITTQELPTRPTVCMNTGRLSDNRYFYINSFGDYSVATYKSDIEGNYSNKVPWYPPEDISLISRYSIDPTAIELFLICTAFGANEMSESDRIVICQVFETWMGLRRGSDVSYKLYTAGDIMLDYVERSKAKDIISAFKSGIWNIGYRFSIPNVSEDLRDTSILGCIECVRRVSIPVSSRETMNVESRLVDLYKIGYLCPLQTQNNEAAGTDGYLAAGCYISLPSDVEYKIAKDGGNHSFYNGKYVGKVDKDSIILNGDASIFDDKGTIWIWSTGGRYTNRDSTQIFSITEKYIPFRNHNAAIRAVFGIGMIRKAVTQDSRYTTGLINNCKYLVNGEQPEKGVSFPVPWGFNLLAAITPYFGYNVEDAIVISKSAAKRMESISYYVIDIPLTDCERLILLDSFSRITYDKDCVIEVGNSVDIGDIIATRYCPGSINAIDNIRTLHAGVVDKVVKGEKCFKVRIACKHILEVGDKITSRHGQKGVVSLIVPDDHMPCINGQKYVDIVINPYAYHKRGTFGQLIEMGNKLHEVTIKGRKVENPVIVGKCFYMVLTQQVIDKWQFRNVGKTDKITKQPIKGKSKGGGIRFSHMEKDAMLAAGANIAIKELMGVDTVTIKLCNICNVIGSKCDHNSDSIIKVHQSLLIVLAYFRVFEKDILLFLDENGVQDKYQIVDFKWERYPSTKFVNKPTDLLFGYDDVNDFRRIRTKDLNLYVIPGILQKTNIYKEYIKAISNVKAFDKVKSLIDDELNGKEGALRDLVEVKRVNHCARSVVTPDPSIDVDTVAIPYEFDIGTNYALLNRQPTLSYESMISVKLIHHEHKTIGINPLLCKSLNADFDGDEVNLYGLKNESSIDDIVNHCPPNPQEIQDYKIAKYLYPDSKVDLLEKLTYRGLTVTRQDIQLMVDSKSKGDNFDIKTFYNEIGIISVNEKIIGNIKSSYEKGLSQEEYILLSRAAREGVISTAVNTPVVGRASRITARRLMSFYRN